MMMFALFPILIIGLVIFSTGVMKNARRRNSMGQPTGGRIADGTVADDNKYMPLQASNASDYSTGMVSKVFRLAAKRRGRLTLSDIVIESGLGLKEAERFMDSLVDGPHVQLEVDAQGLINYEFPEIQARLDDLQE